MCVCLCACARERRGRQSGTGFIALLPAVKVDGVPHRGRAKRSWQVICMCEREKTRQRLHRVIWHSVCVVCVLQLYLNRWDRKRVWLKSRGSAVSRCGSHFPPQLPRNPLDCCRVTHFNVCYLNSPSCRPSGTRCKWWKRQVNWIKINIYIYICKEHSVNSVNAVCYIQNTFQIKLS